MNYEPSVGTVGMNQADSALLVHSITEFWENDSLSARTTNIRYTSCGSKCEHPGKAEAADHEPKISVVHSMLITATRYKGSSPQYQYEGYLFSQTSLRRVNNIYDKMVLLNTSIEIAASPAEVRAKVYDRT